MNELFLVASHNTVVALGLAVVVWGVTRVWRNPAVAHLLWLVVLLKLVAPPLMHVDWASVLPSRGTDSHVVVKTDVLHDDRGGIEIDSRPLHADVTTTERGAPNRRPDIERPAEPISLGRTSFASRIGIADSVQSFWGVAKRILLSLWLGGALVCAFVSLKRIVRFETMLKATQPASERLQRVAREIADKFHVRRLPDVRSIEWIDVPLLWCAGRRPTIVLPVRLTAEFGEEQSAMILAHEMAHLRRRDHWVRVAELIVSAVYWWNPLVWLIRRQIHAAEELCCDAWVRLAFPNREKAYAEALLKAAELTNSPRPSLCVLPVSPFLGSLSLKARIEMILKNRITPSVSAKSMAAIAVAALLVLPSFVQTIQAEARDDSSPAARPPVPASSHPRPQESEFSYAVRFEQGATKFLNGDQITILEVRGTAATFEPGNLYWIKGTYTLVSHDGAMLAAFTTAREAKDGTGPTLKFQTTTVKKGSGTFTLFYPMSCAGWPHVSYYPTGGGSDFGGNYYGTGDNVLRQWWGTKPAASHAQQSGLSLFQQMEKLGGRIELSSEKTPGDFKSAASAVTAIDFGGSRSIQDQDLLLLSSFPNVRTIGVGRTRITDAGLENLAQFEKSRTTAADSSSALTTLYIDNTAITDSGLKSLGDLPKLSTLGLGHTRITDTGLEAVRQLGKLTHLYIDNTGITDAGLPRLSNLANLNTLGLGHTAITDAGLKTVSEFKKLTHLYLDNTKITDAGLAELKDLSHLTTLGLGHTSVTDAGLEQLKGLKYLATLYLDHTQVADAGVQRLQAALPQIEIVR
jgi:beta-lactamase regulating signal transducer with metallopeptidase domain/Leucine-rich repeat (LRR) protein